jgi:hypothetical protein
MQYNQQSSLTTGPQIVHQTLGQLMLQASEQNPVSHSVLVQKTEQTALQAAVFLAPAAILPRSSSEISTAPAGFGGRAASSA